MRDEPPREEKQEKIRTNRTIFTDADSLIDQKTHQSDLTRWENTVKSYHKSSLPVIPNPGDDVRLAEYETRRRQEEERMRKYEIELNRWREDMKKYHLEISKLQEDSRRYRAG